MDLIPFYQIELYHLLLPWTVFHKSLLISDKDDNIKVGSPLIKDSIIRGEVINEGRDKKIVIFKKRRRKDSKLKKGFRRDFTRVRIIKIEIA